MSRLPKSGSNGIIINNNHINVNNINNFDCENNSMLPRNSQFSVHFFFFFFFFFFFCFCLLCFMCSFFWG